MGEDFRKKIREIGSELSPEMFRTTGELFASSALRPDRQSCRVERDRRYGPHERNRLDLFIPARPIANAPLLLYVHGGGFVQGDKGDADAPFYNNIGAWAASCGLIGATMNYRLAPDHAWPAGAEDIGRAVEWLVAHGAAPDLPVRKVVVMGQSAGAAHVAGYVALPSLHTPQGVLAGAAMLSGLYDLVSLQHGPFERAYFGDDPRRFESQSPLAGLLESDVPCLFTVAEYDGAVFQQQAVRLVQAWWEKRGRWPRLLFLPDENHMSPALRIGHPEDFLSSELLAFILEAASETGEETGPRCSAADPFQHSQAHSSKE